MTSGEKAGESSMAMKMWICLGGVGAGSQPARSSSARSGYVLLMYDDSVLIMVPNRNHFLRFRFRLSTSYRYVSRHLKSTVFKNFVEKIFPFCIFLGVYCQFFGVKTNIIFCQLAQIFSIGYRRYLFKIK
jgi:hypothetical protein